MMLRLPEPRYTSAQAIDACREGITGNNELFQKVSDESQALQDHAVAYIASASTGELYTIRPIPNHRDYDPLVVGQLKKSELIKLYSTYFVKPDKPGRTIYTALMAAANEKCPFCGGIGRPRNLDHYLPKAHYPQYSVLPVNLIPSCRDCNMDGKGESHATCEEEQLLHPYLDHERYFEEQWLCARYLTGENDEPGVIEYFVKPPENWTGAQKRRVRQHFDDFDLGLRFSKEAAARLTTILAQIQSLTTLQLPSATVKSTILQPVIDTAPFVNHWEAVMCQALMCKL